MKKQSRLQRIKQERKAQKNNSRNITLQWLAVWGASICILAVSSVGYKALEETVKSRGAEKVYAETKKVTPTPTNTPTPTIMPEYDPRSPKGIAKKLNEEMFGDSHWTSLEILITNESGWNPFAVNGSSGACGLGQAMPCAKMDCENWDYECQVKWTLNYIQNRYKNPTKALAFWKSRMPINGQDVGNWY